MSRQRGFTLIELLVGLAILVMLIGLIQGIYAATARSRDSAEKPTAMIHGVSSNFNRMCDELSAAFTAPDRPAETLFLLTTDDRDQSTLEFATLMPPVHGLRAGGETRVRYETAPDKDTEIADQVILSRTELDDLQKDMDRDGVTYDMQKGITHFRAECFDGKEWVKNWGDGANSAPTLPKAVRLIMTWGEKENEETFRTATTVYRGQ